MLSEKIKAIIKGQEALRFHDIETEFNFENNRLFKIDKYAQISTMGYSMANFYPLFADILDELKPKKICEIGVDTGFTTYLLNDLCEKYDGRLHGVDPCLNELDLPVKSNKISYFKENSFEYLSKGIHNDVYFIDGEHTYNAVYNELLLIHKNNQNDSFKSIVFLHDMNWPHAYRDVIYNKDEYPYSERKMGKGFLFPSSSTFVEFGMPMFYADVVDYEGGKKNGLLLAVEDFLTDFPEYDFCKVPSIYGFGIVWNKNDTRKELLSILEKKKRTFEEFYSFLGYLEMNRFLFIGNVSVLHQDLNHLHAHAQNLENERNHLQAHAQNLENERNHLQTHAQALRSSRSFRFGFYVLHPWKIPVRIWQKLFG